MKLFVTFFICLLFSSTAFSNICDRTLEVKAAIMSQLKKNCQAIEDDDLATLTELEFSLPSGIQIDTLQSGDFSGLVNLKALTIVNGGLSELPVGIFSGLYNLEYLCLQDNHIKVIPPFIFKDLKKLRELYLGLNPIERIPEAMLEGLTSLEGLQLTSRLELPNGFLQKQSQLKLLSLEGWSFESLDLSGLNKLESLYIGEQSSNPNNYVAISKDALSNLPKLKELYLYDLILEQGFLGDLPSLERLHIGDNLMRGLTKDDFLGVAKSLKDLTLEGKGYNFVEESPFVHLSELTTLSVSFDKEDGISFDYFFKGLDKVENLVFTLPAETATLPKNTFQELPSLKSLVIKSRLASLPVGIFRGLDRLENLTAFGLKITELKPEIFSDLKSLVRVALSYGELRTLPSELFQNLFQLKEILLNSNAITTLPKDIFLSLKAQIDQIDLRNNPLDEETKTNLKANFGAHVEL